MNSRDLNMAICEQLRQINKEAGAFVAGILSNDISGDEQIRFALRLVRLAEYIKERAGHAAGMVVEGGVLDDSDDERRALPAGAVEQAGRPRPAADG